MRLRKANTDIPAEDIELIAQCSDAFAHPARVEIFRYIYSENLARRVVCNKDLVEKFDYSQATISQHVKKMVIAGLLEVQNKETKSYYFVNIGMLGKYMNSLRKLNTVI